MIAGCPKCSARYRVELAQLGENGAKLRCTKCSAVFLVRAPRPAPAPVVAAAPVSDRVETVPGVSPPPPAADPIPADVDPIPADIDPSQLVLVADGSEERGKQTASAVEKWGLTPILVHDGVEAMLAIQRRLPRVVVLDAALPRMSGFQVCEVVKRNESLKQMNVVLIGAIQEQDQYRHDPSDLYGADVYLEQPDLPDGLMPLLREAGAPISESASSESPSSVSEPKPSVSQESSPVPASPKAPPLEKSFEIDFGDVSDTSNAPLPEISLEQPAPAAEVEPAARPAPASEPSIAGNPELADERERAERLARIAVSEMLLYQPDKFDQALRDGNVEAVLDLEIQEARALIRQRISEEVRAEKDFILVELERVARERSA